jgi:hypothetical protein
MLNFTIRGLVSLEGGEFPISGVAVSAIMTGEVVKEARGPRRSDRIQIGQTVTDDDGSFVIEADDQDPQIALWSCALQNCSEFKFQLACFDRDETLLHETKPLSYADGLSIQVILQEPETAPSQEDWMELGRRMLESQTVRLGEIAAELATLSPRGLFRGWSVQRRLAVLGQLEQALLDPQNQFAPAGARLRFWRLEDDAELRSLRERFRGQERPDLLKALDLAVERARGIGGWAEMEAPGAAERFQRGDFIGGVNHYIEQPKLFPGITGGFESPTIGYRDYLRDRWIDNQRFEQVLGGPDKELATRATMIERLNRRFHQDFATQELADQAANRVLTGILLKILPAPPGTGYGFGVAAGAIEPRGERTDREYLDYLISLSGISLEELEKRYRLNLRRSDIERSNPVLQNIETLQRFFTDSYQSVEDPYAIKPDRKPGTDERLIVHMSPAGAVFPPEGAGPFFLEYEEWLAREEPFFPENHYDPRVIYYDARAPYHLDAEDRKKTRDAVFANSIPVLDFLRETSKSKYVPGKFNHVAVKMAMGAEPHRVARPDRRRAQRSAVAQLCRRGAEVRASLGVGQQDARVHRRGLGVPHKKIPQLGLRPRRDRESGEERQGEYDRGTDDLRGHVSAAGRDALRRGPAIRRLASGWNRQAVRDQREVVGKARAVRWASGPQVHCRLSV